MSVHDIRPTGIPQKAKPAERLPSPTDRRKKPRLRVLQTGECQYPFVPGGWMIFPNPQAAYGLLGGLIKPATPGHDRHW